MKLLLLLAVVMSLKSANGCSGGFASTMDEIDCALFSNCGRDLAYERLRHYNEDSGEYGITTQIKKK